MLALVIVLQAVGGTITFGTVSLNFTLIPIALGAILFGVWGGAFLGLACGIVVLIQVIIGGGFYSVIWLGSAVAGVMYRLVAKKNKYAATFVAAGLVPFINTALFIIGCLCMSDVLTAAYGVSGGDLLVFILVQLITFNFFIEFALNMLLSPAIHRVIAVVERSIIKRTGKGAGSANAEEPVSVEEEGQGEDATERSED